MKHRMKRMGCFVFVGLIALTASFAAADNAVATRPSLAVFDEDVAVSRREMRQYCALIQQLMQQQRDDAKGDQALEHLRKARALWAGIQDRYQNHSPAEYAADPGFKRRLAGIAAAMADMERHLQENRYKKSFQACGFACGLFVKMHEENGLTYALDRIFHLRKTGKTMIAAAHIGGAKAARPLLPDLLHFRDRVLQAPCPWPFDAQKCAAYGERLEALNPFVDRFTVAISRERDDETRVLAKDFLAIMNDAYGAAL